MMKFLNKKHKVLGNKGFSLVELIIVIAIMAVLMAVLAPQLIKYVEKSRVQADDTFMSELKNAVQLACSDDEIYSGLALTGNNVTWAPNSVTGNGVITVTIVDAAASAAMITAIGETIGAEADGSITPHLATSKTYQNAAAVYTIAITVDANGVVSFDETAPV